MKLAELIYYIVQALTAITMGIALTALIFYAFSEKSKTQKERRHHE